MSLLLLLLLASSAARGDVLALAVGALEAGQPNVAARLLESQVDQGTPEAEAMLAALYWLGEGVPQDFKRSLFLYRRAGDAGLPVAQAAMAGMLRGMRAPGFVETGIKVDCEEALWWRLFAVNQGFLEALYKHASDLSFENPTREDCVGHDDYEAWSLFQQAAAQALPEGRDLVIETLTTLPHSDWSGLDVATKIDRYKAYLANIVTVSKWRLGTFYRDGHGIARNPVIAHYWFSLAVAESTNPHVAAEWHTKLEELESEMTEDQITESRDLAKAWSAPPD